MTAAKKANYKYAVGRRKEATAVVKLFPNGKGNYTIQKGEGTISLKEYFGGNHYLYDLAMFPIVVTGKDNVNKFDAEIRITSGGIAGHADAIKLAFARALIEWDAELRGQLKPYGLLKRDPRSKERKKPGLKKARKRPKWSKR